MYSCNILKAQYLKCLYLNVLIYLRDYYMQEIELNNVFLMGSPGSGKTTIGRILGPALDKEVVDVDNDFLESHWKMSVADKVSTNARFKDSVPI